MVINPPLILVSALFFLAVASALYLGAWLAASLILHFGRNRLSPATSKRVLMTALVLPPILAALPTLGGVTLRHSHTSVATEHHSMACQQMFVRLFAAASAGTGGWVSELSSFLAKAIAWLLVVVGLYLVLRLIRATMQLESGLLRYLSPPSQKLSEAMSRVARQMPGIEANRFFECPFPATYSSVLGLSHVRCILARDFVAEATEEELDAVIAHEASHLRFHDLPASFFLAVLNCLFFPLRPVRLLSRRWREAAELACDDAAVAATHQPLAMASAILRASGSPILPSASVLQHSRSLPTVVMPFADEAACPPAKRVERLLLQAQHAAMPPSSESRLHVWGTWSATVALGGIAIAYLISPGMVCYAHCTLEEMTHLLP